MSERPWRNKEQMLELYVRRNLSISDIADIFDCSPRNVSKWRNRHNIPSGNLPNISIYDGYECFSGTGNNHGRITHHQLLAIADGADPHKIYSKGEYQVHHKNGIKWDNRLSNIEVMSRSEHQSLHYPEQYDGEGWREFDVLYEMYVEQKMSTYEIADELGCSDVTISNWLSEHEIETR